MSAEYPSVPARVLRERRYSQVTPPAYVSIPGGPGSQAEHAEAEQPGGLPYARRKNLKIAVDTEEPVA